MLSVSNGHVLDHSVVHRDGEAFQGERVAVDRLPESPPHLEVGVVARLEFRDQGDLHLPERSPGCAHLTSGELDPGCLYSKTGWLGRGGQAKKGDLRDCEGHVVGMRGTQELEGLERKVLEGGERL